MLHFAVGAGGGRYFLYSVVTGATPPPRYIVETDGSVVPWLGGVREYRVEEIADTGKTYTRRDK